MIPQRYIIEWRHTAPWTNDAQVEQDLVISRALVEMFQSELLRNALAFRGGTALHKLFIAPQVRYSEDIDLVQISSEPIKPILMEIRNRLSFLGTKRVVKQHILPFSVKNSWFSGDTIISTYKIEELLGTKLRALYQRRKGRDLFDLFWALQQDGIDLEQVLICYRKYMEFTVDKVPSKKQFLQNMEDKMKDEEFLSDMRAIIRPGINYSPMEAWILVKEKLIDLL